ncbi:UNVERIFIED_CONTAM: hypothetical protein Slati_3249800 [Sesamum latifolium]|uniref:Uncharacterized protein n=1 Tax=Sesamum latifolium TaxID=2727402 RepID=A0AAW2UYR3_9LAMI
MLLGTRCLPPEPSATRLLASSPMAHGPSCILQFWLFRSSIKPCKCPLCSCRIVNLKPETSQLIQPPDDIVEVLKKVHQYNGLHISGLLGAFHRLLALPLFMGRVFRVLIDPDGLRCTYYVMRLLGWSRDPENVRRGCKRASHQSLFHRCGVQIRTQISCKTFCSHANLGWLSGRFADGVAGCIGIYPTLA